jgi:hypothetical protein
MELLNKTKIVNLISLQVLTYSLTLIYDDDVRMFGPSQDAAALQLQSLFGAGLLMKF